MPCSRHDHIPMHFNVAIKIAANRRNLSGSDFKFAHKLLSVARIKQSFAFRACRQPDGIVADPVVPFARESVIVNEC